MAKLLFLLSGLVKSAVSPLTMFAWNKKTGARLYPFFVGILVYFLISLVRGLIRSGFSQDDIVANLMAQAVLTSLLEEVGRYAAFRKVLQSDSRSDSVSYGAGHALPENLGAAVMSLGAMGMQLESPVRSGLINLFEGSLGQLCGTFAHIALSVIIFWGIQTDRTKYVLPTAIAIHFILNLITAFAPVGADTVFSLVLTAFLCYIANKMYSEMYD